jgi:Mrp family chromosome partitioning ATPase
MADALKVGAVCDGTVLVARLDRITQPILNEVVAVLDPIQVLGLVANGVKGQPNRYRSYGNPAGTPVLTGA